MSNYQLVKNNEWKEVEVNGEIVEIPNDWEIYSIDQLIIMEKNTKNSQIPNAQIKSIGQVPVIGQETSFISGYTNDVEPLIATKEDPTIIFGDHSCSLKLIDFDYALGGDGTKVFKGNNNILTNFLFYSIKNLNFVTDGYKRHFSILKEKIINSPPLKNQVAIASILSTQESVIHDIESLISKYESRFQYLSDELLSGRLRVKEVDGETIVYKNAEDNWKEVEVNGEMVQIPQDWEVDYFLNKNEFISGVTIDKEELRTQKKENDTFFLRANNIEESGKVNFNNLYYISAQIKNEQFLKENDILICLASGSKNLVGKTALVTDLPNKSTIGSFCGIIRTINPFKYYITNNYDYKNWLNQFEATSIFNLKRDNLLKFECKFPTNKEQVLISNILNGQQNIISENKEMLIKEKHKFNWLLDNLLSGKYLIKEI